MAFKNFEGKKEYLDNLYYKVGNQKSDFELCFMDKKRDINSKWRKWSEIGFDIENEENKKWVTLGNNRTILKNEVVLDLEDSERFEEILRKLKSQGLSFRAFKTGSKGYHFHLIFKNEVSPEDKLKIIECYECDTQKSSERCMIALEFEKHWKTGNYKELIEENGEGLNYVEEILSKNNFREDEEKKSEEEKKVNNKKTMAGFVLCEDEVIKSKVFPVDYHNDLFWYGLLLPKNIDNEVRGKKIGKKQIWSPTLITSAKELLEYSERVKEDLGINFENIPSMLPRRWRLEDIRDYLYGDSENFEFEELLSLIIKQYEKYLYIRNPVWYQIHTLWDIGTYLYQIFEAYPFFELRGIAGTGKTKAMTVSSYITFNGGQIMANPSESTLFRETDEVRGTKYFDEAEKLWVYNKSTKQYEGDVRTELINASYTKEAKVPRQEKIGNKFITKWYSPYSPCMLGSINGLYGATETRAITRITTKSPNEDSRGEIEPSEDREELIWTRIRDMCYRFGLNNWKEIKKLYNNFPKDVGLKRRDYQIWKPLLTIAKFISEDLFMEVVGFAKEITERKTQDLITESSFDYMCLESLRFCVKSADSDKIYLNSVKFAYCNLRGDEEGKKDIYLNRNIAKHLDKLGFNEMRKKDRKGLYYMVTMELFDIIVAPLCPDLAFLSSHNHSSSHSSVNSINNDEDSMTISDNKFNEKNEKRDDVMISDDNDDISLTEENRKKCSVSLNQEIVGGIK